MSKIKVVVSAPVDTYSGYGARSRDFVKALLGLGEYDVKILSQRWGSTRFGYLEDHKEHELKSLIIPKLTSKPDIWIQITIPSEFQAIGTYNIGVTAGIETTICDVSWLEGCNRMNVVLTSSEHSKAVFEQTKYTDKKSGKKIELTSPIDVLFEGADLSTYFKKEGKVEDSEINRTLDSIEESWCWLFVGHWLQGDHKQDRKNISWTIEQFLETFKNKKNPPALILKTQHANASISDRDNLMAKIDKVRARISGTLPNIYLLHGELQDSEINELYNHPKVKAMVNLTKGEGFGRPLLEFSLVGKPIVTSAWSGHLDFLNREYTNLVGGRLEPVHKSAQQKAMILEHSHWFQANEGESRAVMKDVYKNYKHYVEKAKRLRFETKSNFSLMDMQTLLGNILERRLPDFPKQVELSMPSLSLPTLSKSKESSPTLPKLNLPKIK